MAKEAKLGKAKALIPELACPKCPEKMELRKRMPKGIMYWCCKSCSHDQPKVKGDQNG